ncbi:MAG TPA: sugar ABC transporter substrate-binding protein [Candidatus Pullichristensenella excrementigallinarum]|uniref:Sugar ABC transporter substrate-binding protein n=1 Tax=Candidatus Pullichristensenella excrementigallinarum TaxID=2840907 RepID=A0A9D1LDQ1_9FIRM|nr:sugar ABC transporter substrate-binding protein [Candidatus Pullichristensenella excrementigallinarum]
MKKLLSILLALMLVLGMSFGAVAEELPRVAFICKGYSDTYTYLVGQIFMEYWEENYSDLYTVEMFDGEIDNNVINELLETCVVDGFDAIILQQNDPDSPVPIIQDAVSKGIYVIVTVGSVNDDGASYYLDADPVQQGSLLVDYAVEQGMVTEGTNCVILRGIDGTFHADGRHEGFITGLEAAGANIIDDQTANWTTSEAQPIVEAWLVSNPEIECIFAANDDMALGAINAMEMADRMDIKVFSVDANELGCIALKEGKLTATVAQDTFGYAHGAADYAAKLLQGEEVESQRLDSQLILLDQVDDILSQVHGYTEEEIAAIG